jgi:predicted lipase
VVLKANISKIGKAMKKAMSISMLYSGSFKNAIKQSGEETVRIYEYASKIMCLLNKKNTKEIEELITNTHNKIIKIYQETIFECSYKKSDIFEMYYMRVCSGENAIKINESFYNDVIDNVKKRIKTAYKRQGVIHEHNF